jgi:hypothetical protein
MAVNARLMDPAEIRQLPMHRQAVTTVETMPPVKWTYPKSVKTGALSLPRTYGTPRVVTFIEAERATRDRRLREASLGRVAQTESAPVHTVSDAASEQGRAAVGVAPAAPPEVASTAHEAAMLKPAEDAAAEQIVREKTREAVSHLFAALDGSDFPFPMSSASAATALDKVLNP